MVDNRPEPQSTTTNAGIPAPGDEQSLSVGRDGPVVLHDAYLIEKVAQSIGNGYRNGLCTPRAAGPTVSSG